MGVGIISIGQVLEKEEASTEQAAGVELPPGVVAISEGRWQIEKPIAVSFNVRAKYAKAGSMGEYTEQLREQQDGINQTTVQICTDRRSSYEVRSRLARTKRASGEDPRASTRDLKSEPAQAQMRANYRSERLGEVIQDLISDPVNDHLHYDQMMPMAERLVDSEMAQLHPLHAPDQIA